MAEDRETRVRRLSMRSMRRGIREMDLILSAYANRALGQMSPAELELYDAFLSENDHDLYRWVSGAEAPPERYAALVGDIARGSQGLVAPRS